MASGKEEQLSGAGADRNGPDTGRIQSLELMPLIERFGAISLQEMESVSFMNRQDSKYLIRFSKLEKLLTLLSPNYRLLEIEGRRPMAYRNLYYDTEDLKLYLSHHNGKLNRYKVRKRQYVESDLSFLEVKFKSNKGRTIKSRIKIKKFSPEITAKESAFLEGILPESLQNLVLTSSIDFTRLTFVHKDFTDRCTLDLGLWCDREGTEGKAFPHMAICEIKSERFSRKNDFIRALEELQVYPMRVSKYCTSVLHLYPGVKYNRFKEKLRYIERLKEPLHASA